MAEFCAPCTDEVFGSDLENDFSWLDIPQWLLCEGCGVHLFLPGGQRVHDEMYVPNFDEECPHCKRLVRQRRKTSDRSMVQLYGT